MLLPFLGSEGRTDLTSHGYKGVIAIWRPMDLEDKAAWADECRQKGLDTTSATAKLISLRRQLLRVEGLEVEEAPESQKVEGLEPTSQPAEPPKTTRPFDVAKDFSRLPLGFLTPVWLDMFGQSSLSEADAKN